MRPFILLIFLTTSVFGQDSTRRVIVYDHTLDIPASWEYHLESDNPGYITNKIDTLFFSAHMAVMPVGTEKIYYDNIFGDPKYDSLNAETKRHNDSLRAEDPRVGTYHNTIEHGDHFWYVCIYPMKNHSGTISVEITPDNCCGFLLFTTRMEWSEMSEWKEVLRSLKPRE